MTRVAYVCADPGIPVLGCKGASVHVQEVVRAMVRRGCDVTLFAARSDGPERLEGVRVVALPNPRGATLAERERAALAANADLARALREHAPFDVVYERYSLFSSAGMAAARDTGAVAVLEVNAPLVEEQARHRGLHDRATAQESVRRAAGAADLVVAVSAPVARWAVAHGAAPQRTIVAANAVDPQRFDLPRVLADDTFTVGFVGTLKPWHGLEVLAEAFVAGARRRPSWRLLVVGDGPQREALGERLDGAGLAGRATFAGSVAPSQVPAQLARMDAAVAPYRDAPGCYFSPLKLYEYLAAGVPVVASAVGEIAEVIADGRNGLLVAPGDAPALTAALQRLHADPPLRAALSAHGRATIRDGHTWDDVVGTILGRALSAREAAA